MRTRRLFALLVATASMQACGEHDTTSPPEVRRPAKLAIYAGDGQSAVAGSSLPIAPAVLVTDSSGLPVSSIPVSFSVWKGLGRVANEKQTTNAEGIATAGSWTLGYATGPNALQASVSGLTTVHFYATATPGPAAAIEVASGDHQTSLVASALYGITFLVSDERGNPISLPTPVSFAVVAGGGVLESSVAITDRHGIVVMPVWTLGQVAAVNRAAASVAGVPPAEVTVTTVGFAVTSIAAGGNHSCALNAAGEAYCWGANDAGQLGDGTTIAHSTPVAVSGDFTFIALAAGDRHTCGLADDHSIICWGANESGQLGTGTMSLRESPTRVVGGHVFLALAAGGAHTCAIANVSPEDVVFCWGNNMWGQLGDGSFTSSASPVQSVGVGNAVDSTASPLAVGASATCVLAQVGVYTWAHTAWCWGRMHHGDGTTTTAPSPTELSSVLGLRLIAAGGEHFCGVNEGIPGYTLAGQVGCWGLGDDGALGNGSLASRYLPSGWVISGDFIHNHHGALALGGFHSCAASHSGAAVCWGANGSGQLGDGSTVMRSTPVSVVPAPSQPDSIVFSANGFDMMAAGAEHTCGIVGAVGAVFCWGSNASGQVGDGSTTTRLHPTLVATP